MRRITMFALFCFLSLIYLSCTPRAVTPETKISKPGNPIPELPQSDWSEQSIGPRKAEEKDWNLTLEKAGKEGKLNMYITGGPEVREALTKALFDRFGIRADIVSLSGSEAVEKIKRERTANLYQWDIGMSGTTTFVTILKPEGMLSPLRPVLILPEVLDPKAWHQESLPFVDKEQRYIFASLASPSTSVIINTSAVKPEELKSYKDLLNPKWKEKISILDPTIPGSGLKWFGVMVEGIMGADYMRKLAEQKPVFSRNKRLLAEWLAREKYPITISVGQDAVKPYFEAGVPLKLIIMEEGTYISTSGGGLVLLDKAPHPNAAKVFLNWFLSRDGATVYQNAYGAQSARVDVPTDKIDQEEVRKPGARYYNPEKEDFLLKQPNQIELAKEIFGPLIK